MSCCCVLCGAMPLLVSWYLELMWAVVVCFDGKFEYAKWRWSLVVGVAEAHENSYFRCTAALVTFSFFCNRS